MEDGSTLEASNIEIVPPPNQNITEAIGSTESSGKTVRGKPKKKLPSVHQTSKLMGKRKNKGIVTLVHKLSLRQLLKKIPKKALANKVCKSSRGKKGRGGSKGKGKKGKKGEKGKKNNKKGKGKKNKH